MNYLISKNYFNHDVFKKYLISHPLFHTPKLLNFHYIKVTYRTSAGITTQKILKNIMFDINIPSEVKK